jgi:hypothetical protein
VQSVNTTLKPALKITGDRNDERYWRRMLPFSDVIKAVEEVSGELWDIIAARRGGWAGDLALCVGQLRCGRLTLKELGGYTGMKQQAVSNAVARFWRSMTRDEDLKSVIRKSLF